MTAATVPTMRDFGGLIPSKGNLPIAANTLILRKTIVYVDSAGRADDTATVGNAYGVASSTYDNRTTAPSGGAADAMIADVEFGAFEFAYTGTDPIVGQVMFGVDNNTVSTDSAGGTLGIAGYCTEVNTTTGRCFVLMGPTIVAQIVLAASVAADVATLQTQMAAVQADEISAKNTVQVPLGGALVVATGAPLAVFADGASTTPGTQIADSKSASVRWNNHATPGALAVNVAYPGVLDDAAKITVHALVSKTGATLADATKLTIGAYEVVPGATHDADTNFGGDTGAVVGDAAAKTVTELTVDLAAADVHAYPAALCLTIKPKDGTLGTDDLVLHAVWLTYTRKVQTA